MEKPLGLPRWNLTMYCATSHFARRVKLPLTTPVSKFHKVLKPGSLYQPWKDISNKLMAGGSITLLPCAILCAVGAGFPPFAMKVTRYIFGTHLA
jgi:hypothetical protein